MQSDKKSAFVVLSFKKLGQDNPDYDKNIKFPVVHDETRKEKLTKDTQLYEYMYNSDKYFHYFYLNAIRCCIVHIIFFYCAYILNV